jgi:flagellar motor switch protein FliN/FliY
MEEEIVSAVDFDELVDAAAAAPGKGGLGERLDLVEHVKIQMTVSIGNADLSVADLFALDAGKVIALDKQVDSPVDLCVNGRVVGRGTLVAVGDQFGVRVTEIDAH